MELDKTDRKILALLQHDASLSASEIAERVNLSQPPCWRRIKRLEEMGVIQRRVALLDQKMLGLNVTVFARIKLSAHGKKSLPEFEEQIRELHEVLECHTVMGDYDFLLKIVTRDIDTYEALFRNKLAYDLYRDFGGVDGYATETVLCDATLDGTWLGVYTWGERAKRDDDRIAISEQHLVEGSGGRMGFVLGNLT